MTKKEQYINEVMRLGRKPKSKRSNNGIPESIFNDGCDMYAYYNNLQIKVKKLRQKDTFTEEELETIRDFEEIESIITTNPIEEKTKLCIEEIRRTGQKIVPKEHRKDENDFMFPDNTDMYFFLC